MKLRSALYLHMAFLVATLVATGQTSPQTATGVQPFGSFGGGAADTINLGNLNVHFAIPIAHKAGRGTAFGQNDLVYESSVWAPVGTTGNQVWMPVTSNGNVATYWGWQGLSNSGTSYIGYSSSYSGTVQCGQFSSQWYQSWSYGSFIFYDRSGAHPFTLAGVYTINNCPPGAGPPNGNYYPYGQSATASDGSGLTLSITVGAGSISASLVSKSGAAILVPLVTGSSQQGSYSYTDRNGNQITASNGIYTDTLGQTALTVSGSAPSSTTLSYRAPSGVQAVYTVSYKSYTVKTNFGCSGIGEYNASNNLPAVYLVDKITLPDSTYYQFGYEATAGFSSDVTGRLASVRVPNGGTITYSYPLTTGLTKNGINCADGSAPVVAGVPSLTRNLTPGGQWSYTRTLVSGTHWQTKVASPLADESVYDFQKAGLFFYETQRQVYTGSQTGGTLLLTTGTCYNNHLTSCTTTAVSSSISQTDVTLQYPGVNGQQSLIETKFNSTYELVNETSQYAFGPGAHGSLLRHTTISYASLGNGIVDRPSTVVLDDGTNTISKTTYSYDEPAYPLQNPTGTTPQHSNPSGARGNLTTINYYVTGSTMLTKHFQYYNTGTLYKTWDVNAATTSYTYDTTVRGNSTKSCGNSFPTTVTSPATTNAPGGLTLLTTWDCYGGVATVVTDANGNSVTTDFADAFYWRPDWVKDQLLNETDLVYTPPTGGNPASVETKQLFNAGSSITEHLTTFDNFGRPQFSQQQEAVGSLNYDSTEAFYDALGRPSQATMPYVALAGQSGTAATSATSYDALGRITKVVDGNTVGYTQIDFNQNDVLETRGPQVTGENLKKKQLEYDSIGRLISVCEVTAGTTSWAGGNCAQSNPMTGYWTTYVYDFDSAHGENRMTVAQNAQAGSSAQQHRTFLYDLLGRLVSETNPETSNLTSGTTTYVYDNDSAGDCTGTYTGDLVKKVDNRGNTMCYTYDSLHRVLSITYATVSPDFANTSAKTFVYDAATYNSTAMSNALGRLAEAYTGPSGSKKTDEYFSYSKRGEQTDVYEHTPNSGATAYHVTAGFWANGALNSLSSNISGLPNQTYGIDGKGRPFSVTASSGLNPNLVTSTTYNLSTYVTTVAFGSGDSDIFTLDAATGRMTSYKFKVGTSTSDTGTLTWNANGSLATLAINDTVVGTSDSQTCNYTHDDLSRIASVNCGNAVWRQNFTYDPFGNISKDSTGYTGLSFTPGYSSPPTNQFTSFPGVTPTYDTDGRLTYDGTNHYTWDAESKFHTVDTSPGTTIVYDALGRMVEKQFGTAFTQFVYDPSGAKIAVMTGQTLQTAFIPLPTGAKAVYTSSGLTYIRHHDFLGSSRLATTPSRTLYSSRAYAPFGEQYLPSGTADASFTGQDQDTVNTLYDFPARRYNPNQGRWISPDPLGRGAVNLANPQSWNRYAYVLNNPLRLVDPQGLSAITACVDDDCHVYYEDGDDDGGGGGSSSGGGNSDGGGGGGRSGDCQYSACVTAPDPGQDPCVVFIGGTGDGDYDSAFTTAAAATGTAVYITSYPGFIPTELADQAYDAMPGVSSTPCGEKCQDVSAQINALEQANPQGLLLIPYSGGAGPVNQGAGSSALNTTGISGIIYFSPGSPAGYAPELNSIPTFTYWGSGQKNLLVYAANGIEFNGGGTTSTYSGLPPGSSATIPNCDHDFGCEYGSSGLGNTLKSDCNPSTSENRSDDDQNEERFAVRPKDSDPDKGIAEVDTWPGGDQRGPL